MKQNIDCLVGCEESQAVTIEFRKLGINAFSCDLQDCSGNHPEWHIKGDVLKVIEEHSEIKLLIAFPPCTYLSFVGNSWLDEKKYGEKARQRKVLREQALQFFLSLWNAPIEMIAIENPRGYAMQFVKQTQIIHPYYFGDNAKKTTCLWLKNLPKLMYCKFDNLFEKKTAGEVEHKYFYKSGKRKGKPVSWIDSFPPVKDRVKLRSKTFPGIATAMAAQWSELL